MPANVADVVTPVSIYLKLRDVYPNSILLESSDYHSHSNAMSYVCFAPMAEIIAEGSRLRIKNGNTVTLEKQIEKVGDVTDALDQFINSFDIQSDDKAAACNGIYGYAGYDAVQYFENIKLQPIDNQPYRTPELRYVLYKYILSFNHFSNHLSLVENLLPGEESQAKQLLGMLYNRSVPVFNFTPKYDEQSNVTDDQYKQMVTEGKKHCFLGDVFQIVLSRQFSMGFEGDEFNVYRALRHINPSPYLFYFDYGSYKIFGSSPESQLVIKSGTAAINPIAGTFRRTGDDARDHELAVKLGNDPKESAEHVMLVDLARNDLSRHCEGVNVNTFKEIQYYSHVLHMVSNVSGRLTDGATVAELMGATFPAGTLSGAPKYKAMELINEIENQARGCYGGCIGMMGFDKSFNQAIVIRSFLSKNNRLYYQAGAGVVSQSNEAGELQEVNNKLGALTAAIRAAEKF